MKRKTFYGFATPSLVIMGLLMVFPLVISIWLRFNKLTFATLDTPQFVGFDNYTEILSDPRFRSAFEFTLIFVAVTVPVQIALGFFLAILLDQISLRVRGFFIATFLIPFVVVPVVGTLMFKQLFEPGGLVYWLYREIFDTRFIFNEVSVKSLILVHGVWGATPFTMIVLFAGLQTLPQETVEASMIDGANRWNQVRHVMIPHLRSLFIFLGLISVMDAYRVFDSVFVFTEQNPIFDAEVMMSYTFHTFSAVRRLGKANSASVIMVIMILVILIPFLTRAYQEQMEER